MKLSERVYSPKEYLPKTNTLQQNRLKTIFIIKKHRFCFRPEKTSGENVYNSRTVNIKIKNHPHRNKRKKLTAD